MCAPAHLVWLLVDDLISAAGCCVDVVAQHLVGPIQVVLHCVELQQQSVLMLQQQKQNAEPQMALSPSLFLLPHVLLHTLLNQFLVSATSKNTDMES